MGGLCQNSKQKVREHKQKAGSVTTKLQMRAKVWSLRKMQSQPKQRDMLSEKFKSNNFTIVQIIGFQVTYFSLRDYLYYLFSLKFLYLFGIKSFLLDSYWHIPSSVKHTQKYTRTWKWCFKYSSYKFCNTSVQNISPQPSSAGMKPL